MKFGSDVYQRHRGICFHCGCMCIPHEVAPGRTYPRTATRDHVIAKSLGGRQLGCTNIVLSCHGCNQWWAEVEDQAKRAARLLRRMYRKRRLDGQQEAHMEGLAEASDRGDEAVRPDREQEGAGAATGSGAEPRR